MHWEFYLGLEDDFLRASRYVDFSESNLTTHSQFFTQALASACLEFECVNKTIASVAEWHEIRNICDIKSLYDKKHKLIFSTQLQSLRGEWNIKPFSDWTNEERPIWWQAYNSIKHDRHNSSSNGNLQNAMYATGASYIANLILANTEGGVSTARVRNSPSKLFAIKSINNEGDSDHFLGSVLSHCELCLSKASVAAYQSSI